MSQFSEWSCDDMSLPPIQTTKITSSNNKATKTRSTTPKTIVSTSTVITKSKRTKIPPKLTTIIETVKQNNANNVSSTTDPLLSTTVLTTPPQTVKTTRAHSSLSTSPSPLSTTNSNIKSNTHSSQSHSSLSTTPPSSTKAPPSTPSTPTKRRNKITTISTTLHNQNNDIPTLDDMSSSPDQLVVHESIIKLNDIPVTSSKRSSLQPVNHNITNNKVKIDPNCVGEDYYNYFFEFQEPAREIAKMKRLERMNNERCCNVYIVGDNMLSANVNKKGCIPKCPNVLIPRNFDVPDGFEPIDVNENGDIELIPTKYNSENNTNERTKILSEEKMINQMWEDIINNYDSLSNSSKNRQRDVKSDGDVDVHNEEDNEDDDVLSSDATNEIEIERNNYSSTSSSATSSTSSNDENECNDEHINTDNDENNVESNDVDTDATNDVNTNEHKHEHNILLSSTKLQPKPYLPPSITTDNAILSIDIGVKNLGYTIISYNDPLDYYTSLCIEFDIYNISESAKNGNIISKRCCELFDFMNNIATEYDIKYIIIEKQVPTNIKAMELMYSIYSLALNIVPNRDNIIIFDPKMKFTSIGEKYVTRNKQHKRQSITYARTFIDNVMPNKLKDFEKHNKKDDIADSLNQALVWMVNNNMFCDENATTLKEMYGLI